MARGGMDVGVEGRSPFQWEEILVKNLMHEINQKKSKKQA